MLETPEERIKLLKAGYTGKIIEKLYVEYNNFKTIHAPILIELVEFDIPQNLSEMSCCFGSDSCICELENRHRNFPLSILNVQCQQ